ncbi:hypothetical protein HCMG_01097 [Helicobacter canadensis MIT 98-5491]|nr:hypothetical protein HCMG_01097 [Helicobacter canadensis MIT 98-5491]
MLKRDKKYKNMQYLLQKITFCFLVYFDETCRISIFREKD